MFALLLQLHAPAHAWSCFPPNRTPILGIQQGDSVPPDMPLIGFHEGQRSDGVEDYALWTPEGASIPLHAEWFASSVRFTVDSPLPEGTYTYQRASAEPDRDPLAETVTFSIEGGLPEAIPDAPIDLTRTWSSSFTDGEDKLNVRWTESARAAHYEIEVAPTADFIDPERGFTVSEPAQFGSVDCAAPETFGYDSTTTSFFRIRAIGPHGDASAWSDTLRVGPRPFHGCATAGGTASGFGLVVVLGLLGVRWGRARS